MTATCTDAWVTGSAQSLSRGSHISVFGLWQSWPIGWRQGSEGRSWCRYLSEDPKTLFQNYELHGSGRRSGVARLSGAGRLAGAPEGLWREFVRTMAFRRPMTPMEGYRAPRLSSLGPIGLTIGNQSRPADPCLLRFGGCAGKHSGDTLRVDVEGQESERLAARISPLVDEVERLIDQ